MKFSNIEITKNGFVNLTFTTDVDDNQEPLVMYKVDWGDGETTVVSGVEMRDRPDPNHPHSLYHLYDYWDLLRKNSQGIGDIYCANANSSLGTPGFDCSSASACCTIQPKVWVKDNWGWYNNGTNINEIDVPDEFSEWIVVKER